jgi:hypothetical protein
VKKLCKEHTKQLKELFIKRAVQLAIRHKKMAGDFYQAIAQDDAHDIDSQIKQDNIKHVLHLTYHPCNWMADSAFRAHSVFCLAIAQDGTGQLTTHEPGDCKHLWYAEQQH